MALSDASSDPLVLGSRSQHTPCAKGNAPSSPSAPVSCGQDPLTAAFSGDCLAAEGDEEAAVKSEAPKAQRRSHAVQRADRPSQNGDALKQNGSLRNLPVPPAAPSSPAVTDSHRLVRHHYPPALSPSASPPLQPPPLCCQHCHFHAAVCCPCGQQECPLLKSPGADPESSSGPHPGAPSPCPCCLSACTYSHPHHPPPPLSHHHQHHQCWQEHLQSQTPGIR